MKTALCPLCGEELKSKKYKTSYTYICPACPFVGVEYYTEKDAENLNEFLKS